MCIRDGRTDVLDGVDQHDRPHILHAAPLVKKDLEGVGESGVLRLPGRLGGLPGLSGRLCASALNLLDQGINFLQQTVDILRKGLLLSLIHIFRDDEGRAPAAAVRLKLYRFSGKHISACKKGAAPGRPFSSLPQGPTPSSACGRCHHA